MTSREKHNITVIGAPGVGKSAITLRLLYQEFVDDYEPTKLDSYQTKMNHKGEEVDVQITDTAGQEDYASVRDTFLRSGEGFLCVFSLTDSDSFAHIQELYEQVKLAKSIEPPQLPFLIIGNKADLENSRQISREAGEGLAARLGVKYMESSAKTNENVSESFQYLIGQLVESRMADSTPMETTGNKKKRKKRGGVKRFLCGLA